MRGVFVTGTDTGSGKTLVAAALIHALRGHGLVVAGFKPVAAGAGLVQGQMRNEDALALLAASGLDLPYADVNPYCFAPPIAPHIAAAEQGCRIEAAPLLDAAARLAEKVDYLVTEGAGGWRVPLSPELDMQGLAALLGLPVVLVVGLRLGCLNHALLTADAIRAAGQPLAGWVGSALEPNMARYRENLDTLHARLDAPCLGVLPHAPGSAPRKLAPCLDIAPLLSA
jgi:dethiobiotin synthetase